MSYCFSLSSSCFCQIQNWIMTVALAVLISGPTNAYSSNTDEPVDVDIDCFVFLVTGKPTTGTPKEEIQQMQTAHLQNFDRLAKIKKLSAAGPCADPEKRVRGIVVVHASSLAKAESLFETDPYITQGFMKPEIHPYKSIVGKFVIPENEQSLDKYTLVILSKKEGVALEAEQSRIVSLRIQSFAKKHYDEGNLGFAGLFEEPANVLSPRVGVMVFRSSDIDLVKENMKEIEPAISESLQWQVFQQYMVKDAMPGKK